MGLRRGDVVIVAASGDYGKPRPALVVQADEFLEIGSVVVALMTSLQHPSSPLLRKPIAPTSENGLLVASDVMIDKILTFPIDKVKGPIGHLANAAMIEVSAALALFLGL